MLIFFVKQVYSSRTATKNASIINVLFIDTKYEFNSPGDDVTVGDSAGPCPLRTGGL